VRERSGVAGKATIAIIGGTGALGAGLAWRLAGAGHAILIGSRSAHKAEAAANTLVAKATGMRPRGASNADAAKSADIVFVTVPWASHAAILDEIAPHVVGKLVVDTTVPLVPPRVAPLGLAWSARLMFQLVPMIPKAMPPAGMTLAEFGSAEIGRFTKLPPSGSAVSGKIGRSWLRFRFWFRLGLWILLSLRLGKFLHLGLRLGYLLRGWLRNLLGLGFSDLLRRGIGDVHVHPPVTD